MTNNMHEASCVTPNAIRGSGTEAGAVSNPNWSSINWTNWTNGPGGDIGTQDFMPSEADTTLQLTDSWFYDPEVRIHARLVITLLLTLLL